MYFVTPAGPRASVGATAFAVKLHDLAAGQKKAR
jgi:hypothetical protein